MECFLLMLYLSSFAAECPGGTFLNGDRCDLCKQDTKQIRNGENKCQFCLGSPSGTFWDFQCLSKHSRIIFV